MKILKLSLIILVNITVLLFAVGSYAKDDIEKLIRDKDFEKLEALGKDGVEPLLILLNGEISFDRGKAAESLGRLKDGRAISPLLSALGDKSEYVVKRVIEALESITGQKLGNDIEAWNDWWQNYTIIMQPKVPPPPPTDEEIKALPAGGESEENVPDINKKGKEVK